MIEMDDAAIAAALIMEQHIDHDLRDPQRSILVAQLAEARKGAIDAMRALTEADPFEPKVIMLLQNDVRRFRSLATWLCNQQLRAAEGFAQLPPEEQDAVLAFTHPTREINDA